MKLTDDIVIIVGGDTLLAHGLELVAADATVDHFRNEELKSLQVKLDRKVCINTMPFIERPLKEPKVRDWEQRQRPRRKKRRK